MFSVKPTFDCLQNMNMAEEESSVDQDFPLPSWSSQNPTLVRYSILILFPCFKGWNYFIDCLGNWVNLIFFSSMLVNYVEFGYLVSNDSGIILEWRLKMEKIKPVGCFLKNLTKRILNFLLLLLWSLKLITIGDITFIKRSCRVMINFGFEVGV